jgi:hypothetical protein
MSKKIQREKRYNGYFLMDSGLKIPFDISEEEGGENFSISLYGNMQFPFEKGEVIWLGEKSNFYILADRIVGWDINEYKLEN